MIALFWDIDGTLLTTARAGVFALQNALVEVTGKQVDLFDKVNASGQTEHEIAETVFRAAEVVPSNDLIDRFLRAYERRLPDSLPRMPGRVMQGVREVLEDLHERDDVRNVLLTGNTQAGAHAKLAHYGLLKFFDEGAFCVGPGPRSAIAQAATELVPKATGRYVIGDTPHDIACGKAIAARTIAIATGSFSRADLERETPWIVLDHLPDPAEFRRLIGLP